MKRKKNKEERTMSRLEFLSKTMFTPVSVVAAGSLLSALGCSEDEFNTDQNLPNIIFLTADDLGWKALSSYGNTDIETPNIDRLAAGGALFENAFVVSSSCAPSRASLITGQYPHTHGVTGLTHIYKLRSLSPFHDTLPDHLSEEGYNTALQGKWHVSPYLPASWYGYNNRLSGIFPEDFKIHTAEKTIDYIKQNKDNRFYLEVNYMQNHRDAYGEFHMDEDFPVDYRRIRVPGYWTLPDSEELRKDAARYYSQTLKMDHMIGEILDTLDELSITEQTMVIFTSDNGPPYPGNKMTMYDRGTGVPLLIRYPQKIKPQKRYSQLISSIDIMPTMLEAVGLEVPAAVQGYSLYPLINSDTADDGAYRPREAVFFEMTDHVYYIPGRAVRTERYKYIRNYSDITYGLDQNNHDQWAHELSELENQPWKRPRVPEELYDLKNDPNEQNNLIKSRKHKKILEKLKTMLENHMRETDDPYLGEPFTHDYEASAYEPSEPGEKYK